MIISKREKVTKHGFCKILRGKFGLPGSLSVIQVLNFNFNLIVTQVNKWIPCSCILDVRHRNVGNWVTRPRSRYSLFKFKWEGRLFEAGRLLFDPQKLKIKNLQSQFSMFVAKKGKIEHHTSIFWKSKTKNWKWPVSGFNFLFSISSSQDSSY